MALKVPFNLAVKFVQRRTLVHPVMGKKKLGSISLSVCLLLDVRRCSTHAKRTYEPP